MDNHVGFYTEDLDYYVKSFQDGGVPFFPSSFTDPTNGKQFFAVLVNAPGSLDDKANSILNIMLVGNSSSLIGDAVYKHLTSRASTAALTAAQSAIQAAPRKTAVNSTKPILQATLTLPSPGPTPTHIYFHDLSLFQHSCSMCRLHRATSRETKHSSRRSSRAPRHTQHPIQVALAVYTKLIRKSEPCQARARTPARYFRLMPQR